MKRRFLERYLLRHVGGLFLVIAPGLWGLYLVIELFEHLDEFIEAGQGKGPVVLYLLLLLPRIALDLAPLSVLLAGLVSFSLLVERKEILAMQATGVRPLRILAPYALFGAGVGLLFLAGELGPIPESSAKAKEIWAEYIEPEGAQAVVAGGVLLFHGRNAVWSAERVLPGARDLQGVGIIRYDEEFRPVEWITARAARYSPQGWIFERGAKRVRTERGWSVEPFDRAVIGLPDRPEDFVFLERTGRDIGLMELYRESVRLRALGLEGTELRARFWAALAYPFLGLALLLPGLVLLYARRRGGMALGFSSGLGMGFGAWALWNLLVPMGRAGRIPPWLAPLGLLLGLFIWALVMGLGRGIILSGRKSLWKGWRAR